MEVPLQVGDKVEDTKLTLYCNVNVGFDEDFPKFPRRESNASTKSARSVVSFSEHGQNGYASENGRPTSPTHGGILKNINMVSNLEEIHIDEPPPVPRPKAAVTVRKAFKRYGRSSQYVLNNFNMTVPKGSIYSLLGASGCGKTSVLRCILDMCHLESGEISVFGGKPGTAESGVPGKRVGYTPQEIALYKDFSIDETLRYYGVLFCLSPEDIKTSRDFLMPFLNLPDETKRIGTLSSGQQRRVSLACALIHTPDLLILDEPTVGVDALLRESIWKHLIGLMRGGRLLAENNPENLLKEHNTTLLEDIVLKLCRNDKFTENDDEPNQDEETELNNITEEKVVEFVAPYDKRRFSGVRRLSMFQMEKLQKPKKFAEALNRVKALTLKNVFVMMRNFLLVLFMIIVPSVMVIIICLGIGNDPRPLRLGVVNYEANYTTCLSSSTWGSNQDTDGCDIENLSCKYLEKLPPDIIYLNEYETEEDAVEAVKAGSIWGLISFPIGYSDNVYVRASSGNIIDDAALDGSFISYQLDMSSKQIAGTLKRILHDAYKDFVVELLGNCGFNTKLAESPVKALEPIYGTDDTDFREFIAPSLLLGLLFFFPLCSSSIQYLFDKKLGTLERARVAGVQTWEIMAAFFITEGVILFIQSTLTLLIITCVFGITIKGSAMLALCLTILMGLGGVSMGFLIASFCNEEVEAVMLAMASFFPNALLSGLIWPVEGMPIVMQYVSYLLPCTFGAESMRSIVSRGWGFFHPNVWPGFAAILAWIAAYWLITIFVHKIVLARK